jgi:HlyD family secretion protein
VIAWSEATELARLGGWSPQHPRRRGASPMWRPRGGKITLMVLALCGIFCTSAAGAAEPSRASGMAVTVVRATRACFADTVRVAGTIVPHDEVLVRPDGEGLRVTQVLVESGQTVAAGEALARLARPEGQGPAGSVTLQAPSAGVVSRSGAYVGAIASPGGEPLFRITVGGELDLLADVLATRIPKLKIGQPAKIDVVGVRDLSGRVSSLAAQIDPVTQAGRARIALGKSEKVRIGASAHASIEIGSSCGTSVPLSAVLYGPDGPIVQVVHGDRIETRPVPIGLIAEGKAEIREGLSEGDLVVERAGSFLREGDRVRPIQAEPTVQKK